MQCTIDEKMLTRKFVLPKMTEI